MPIRYGPLNNDLTHRACELIKQKFEESQVTIPRRNFYLSSRGNGFAIPVPRQGDLYVLVDSRGQCRISVPVGGRRRYINGSYVASAISNFMMDYGNDWISQHRARVRNTAIAAQQSETMRRTLERVFSGVGLVFNERRCMMYPERRRFVCREVEYQGLTLALEGIIEDAIPRFTSVTIRGGVTNVRVNKLARALSMLTGQQPCPV
jgi:hypothetical protein